MRKVLILGLLAPALAVLGGCASMPGAKHGDQVQHRMGRVKSRQHRQYKQKPAVSVSNGYFLGDGTPIALPKDSHLPPVFKQKVTLVSSPIKLPQIASRINKVTSVPVTLSAHVESAASSRSRGGSGGGGGSSGSSKNKALSHPMRMQYSGTLKDLLTMVADHYGISWTFHKGRVRFFQYESKTFDIAAAPGNVSTKISFSNKSSSGGKGSKGSGSSNNQGTISTNSDVKPTVWKDIENDVKSMLSDGGKAVINESAGTLTVHDTPDVVDQVHHYVTALNTSLSRQVALDVHVYSMNVSDAQTFSADLNAVYQNLSQTYNLKINGATPQGGLSNLTGLGSLGATVLTPSKSSGNSAMVNRFGGSNTLVQALRKKTHVHLVTSGSGLTLNGQTLPIQDVSSQGYLQKEETSQTSNVGSSTTLTPGTVTTGFSMQVTPRVLSGGRVILQYAINMSQLESLKTVKAGGSEIQVPQTTSRSFMQRAAVPTGSTLVLAGFTTNRDQGDLGYGITGYQHDGQHSRTAVLITITINNVDGAQS